MANDGQTNADKPSTLSIEQGELVAVIGKRIEGINATLQQKGRERAVLVAEIAAKNEQLAALDEFVLHVGGQGEEAAYWLQQIKTATVKKASD